MYFVRQNRAADRTVGFVRIVSGMVRYLTVCVCCLMLVCAAIGCGAEEGPVYYEHTSTTVTIGEEGSLIYEIVEPFNEDYYDTAELGRLTSQVLEEFSAGRGEGSAELISVEERDGRVHLSVRFAGTGDYADFMGTEFSYESVSEARARGMTFSDSLRDMEGERLTSEALSGLQEAHVVVVGEPVTVETPYRIRYRSAGVTLTGGYTAVPDDDAVMPMVLILDK